MEHVTPTDTPVLETPQIQDQIRHCSLTLPPPVEPALVQASVLRPMQPGTLAYPALQPIRARQRESAILFRSRTHDVRVIVHVQTDTSG